MTFKDLLVLSIHTKRVLKHFKEYPQHAFVEKYEKNSGCSSYLEYEKYFY